MEIKTIAFYLPQYYPIPENDKWWGKGFTEWTNVSKAKPLYRGHEQPFLPADLGFYDLRVPEVRYEQAELARKSGIAAFAYWHYWFGNGKRLLERPLNEVLKTGSPDFPFCIAWANETWKGKWHGLSENNLLIEQTYPGLEDEKAFFIDCLPYFRDKRYLKIDEKIVFIIYRPSFLPDPTSFINHWRHLGKIYDIEFHFIGVSDSSCLQFGFDGFVSNGPVIPDKLLLKNVIEKAYYKLRGKRWQRDFFWKRPEVFSYRDCLKHWLSRPLHPCEYPLVVPNWDNTPRAGRKGLVLKNSTPELYQEKLKKALEAVSKNQTKIIFIKSWNEWAEGNVLEPSVKWGNNYLKATSRVLLGE